MVFGAHTIPVYADITLAACSLTLALAVHVHTLGLDVVCRDLTLVVAGQNGQLDGAAPLLRVLDPPAPRHKTPEQAINAWDVTR